MDLGPIVRYQPRIISDLGLWKEQAVTFKLYALLADGRSVSEDMRKSAKKIVTDDVLPRIREMGDSNDLGFIIIHPGETGLSISAHWWVQGSVLCQHNHRHAYGADEPMDTVTRPVIACVWELNIIGAEQICWQQTMMNGRPAPTAYLDFRHIPQA
ncbi:hypothetical protein [Aestuariispira insulae]|uniref:Uncharacterized protein n=1 Tax=Aestuariispira insulae TaxID=1461337 RepID=A0A3D9HU05_9PROT|nr:hypothetical protein [Aestuariispira insulae]RED52356.1 hypothetical protein DFP90_102377 [Aestuariispira insulae]